MSNLKEIEKSTNEYLAAYNKLGTKANALKGKLAELRVKHIKPIKDAAAAMAEKTAALGALIKASPQLFQSPRTIVISGIKVGIQKNKGTLKWADDAHVIKLIRKHLPDKAYALIKVTEKPVTAGLKNLTVAELEKIAIDVIDTGDQVVIKTQDTEIDKYVKMLLKEEKEAE